MLMLLACAGCDLFGGSSSGDGVHFTAASDVYVFGQTIEAALENDTDGRVGYNLCYTQVERRTEEGWQVVGPDIVCNAVLRGLEAGESEAYQVTLDGEFPRVEGARLVEGRYRLTADIEVDGENRRAVAGPFRVVYPRD